VSLPDRDRTGYQLTAAGPVARSHTLHIAGRVEAELGEERTSFIDGCKGQWAALPIPEGRIVVGLDEGYVRDWKDRKTNFELIVGRSMPEDRESRYIGMVHGYDGKSKRRLFNLLKTQGLQADQSVTFLTDGGEEVRSLTERITPEAEACAGLVPHRDENHGARTVRSRRWQPRRSRRKEAFAAT
jgi:hypothetical protein